MSAPHEGDKSAAFSGLILGGIAIFVICFAVVRLTNAHFANKSHGAAAPAHGAPATGAPPAPGTPAGGGNAQVH